ncbi:C-C motif chemokine 19-like [Echeneis naucrates]|uniref:C-C motif chemokine 19-like n=1 Tax=Echeneis naucrates TaxID=173247 RepID=A0A665WPD4_ECHNA|nr:C-C motif chemokine 19-like [Echeneis naucrates]
MASRVAALLLLGIICTGFAAAELAQDCCKETTTKFVPKKMLESYTIQTAGQGCSISATVFKTKKGRKLCLVPASEQDWIQNHIEFLKMKNREASGQS